MRQAALRGSSAVDSQSSINLLPRRNGATGLVPGSVGLRIAPPDLRWLYQRRARSISNMTDLPDRAKLSGRARISTPQFVFRSADDTRKRSEAGGRTRGGWSHSRRERLTLCLSQVGCTLD
jgi:hypothetical protein